jgi:hypothetical protein
MVIVNSSINSFCTSKSMKMNKNLLFVGIIGFVLIGIFLLLPHDTKSPLNGQTEEPEPPPLEENDDSLFEVEPVEINYYESPFGLRFQGVDLEERISIMNEMNVQNTRTLLTIDGGYFDWNEELEWPKQEEILLQYFENKVIPTGYIPGNSVQDSRKCYPENASCWHDGELGKLAGKISTCPPCNEEEYSRYVQALVERFDGDGYRDAPGTEKILYWQVGDNEGDFTRYYPEKAKQYAKTVQLTYKAMKRACPECKLVLMSAFFHVKSLLPQGACLENYSDREWTLFPGDSCAPKNTPRIVQSQFVNVPKLQETNGDGYFYQLFEELNKLKENDPDFFSPTNTYFDVYSFHFYEHPDGYKALPKAINLAKKTFDEFGFKDIGIVILEFDTYSGQTRTPGTPPFRNPGEIDTSKHRSFEEHAQQIVKRHVAAIANGVERTIYTAATDVSKNDPLISKKSLGWCSSQDNYYCTVTFFDSDGNKKPAYYAYKKMVEILDGSNWKQTEIISETNELYLYKFSRNEKTVFVGWSETGTEYFFDTNEKEFMLIKKNEDNTFSQTKITDVENIFFEKNPFYLIEK